MRSLAVLLLLAGCTVPSLGELPAKRCDATHPCVEGFFCTAAGLCEQGVTQCKDGGTPTTELCDGVDNDCDDAVDEGLFDTVECELKAGTVCAGKHHACVAGRFEATCGQASYGPDWEAFESRCDSKDNDCDGLTDEGGAMCMPQGVCLGHQATCSGTCSAPGWEMIEATCDGLDNDCDGERDEGLTNGVSCGVNQGVCAGKTRACAGDGGYEPTCTAVSFGPTYQSAELWCDGLDNDCNGSVDLRPDGGALPPSGLCEQQRGVCSGALRACADGGPESVCSAASYGALYEPWELTCSDGRDNDCDGVVDRSRELVLAAGGTTQTHVSLLIVDGGVALVYADDAAGTKRVLFKTVMSSGVGSTPLDVSDPQATASTSPSMSGWFPSRQVVTWLDTDSTGAQRVRLAVLDGGVAWRAAVSTGRAIFADPRAAPVDATHVLVAWIDAPTSTLRAAVYDATGAVTTATKVLSTPPLADGGTVEQVLGLDVVDAPSGALIGWTVIQAGDSYVRLRSFDELLQPLSAQIQHTVTGEVARGLKLSRTANTITGAWVGNSTQVRFLLPDAGQRLVANAGATITDLDVAGNAIVWSEGTTTTRLPGAQVGLTVTPLDFTPDSGSALSPAVRLTGAQSAVVAYEVDPGNGFDLRAQSVCLP